MLRALKRPGYCAFFEKGNSWHKHYHLISKTYFIFDRCENKIGAAHAGHPDKKNCPTISM